MFFFILPEKKVNIHASNYRSQVQIKL